MAQVDPKAVIASTELSSPSTDSSTATNEKTAQVPVRVTDVEPAQPHQHYFMIWRTIGRRIGFSTIFTLIITTILIFAVTGFLAFLWFAGIDNQTWHTIVIRGWATRAVSLPSLLLRTAVDLQAGIVAAMVAALALESGSVLLEHSAMISTARADRARPRRLLIPLFRGLRSERTFKHCGDVVRVGAIALLCLTTLFLQFSSTILLSDLHLGELPGLVQRSSLAYDFKYVSSDVLGYDPSGWAIWYQSGSLGIQARETTWKRNPPSYPAFAEYSEPVSLQDGVDDTGTLLRAFLPFADASSRESIRNYSGKAVVLDSRVSCQRPLLDNLSVEYDRVGVNQINDMFTSQLIGTYAPSTGADRLWAPTHPVPFNCSYLVSDGIYAICSLQAPEASMMQLDNGTFELSLGNRGGGLISSFANTTDIAELQATASKTIPLYGWHAFVTWGTPFLILNVTTNRCYDGIPCSPVAALSRTGEALEVPPIKYTMQTDDTLRLEANGVWTDIVTQHGPVNISASICYTAFDSARLDIDAYSDSNRSEPLGHWDPDQGFYTVPDVSSQLGNVEETLNSPLERGIMRLTSKASWIPKPEDALPIVIPRIFQMFARMNLVYEPADTSSMRGNWSTVWPHNIQDALLLDSVIETAAKVNAVPTSAPDPTIQHLFQRFFDNSNSLARSVSSIITLLSSMAYYDQMSQYQTRSDAKQVFFTEALFPQSRHGFWIIVIALIVHALLVITITSSFALRSRYTYLGQAWQSIAQLWSHEAEDLIKTSSMRTDKEVRLRLKASGMQDLRVGVRPYETEERIALISKLR